RELEVFWGGLFRYFGVRSPTPAARVLAERRMPGARWFEGARPSYAYEALRRTGPERAVVWAREDGARGALSRDELRVAVARARAGLRKLGVGPGDRVAAYLPNSPEALVAFLATQSLGAVWSSCSPEFGVASVLDRFGQIQPKVLLGVDGYLHGGKRFERRRELEEIAAALPGLAATVVVTRLGGGAGPGQLAWDALLAEEAPLEFEHLPFEAPIWILYSSGTTGLPKPIVQSQGGILLEHLKALSLHSDLGEGDVFFWFSTTGWMMWNFLVSGLLVGATVVLYEGSPAHPDLGALFRLAEEAGVTYFGTSAPYLLACEKAGLEPRERADLSSVRTLGSTGAPLPASGFRWVYDHVGRDLLLASLSGGTDVCTAFLLSCPLLPVHAGELQCAALGAKVEAFDAAGRPLIGELGELVVTEPMPSMPVAFLGDPDGERLRRAYFADYPGVWRHGDWVRQTERGSFVIHGRSDSTLNRGGVRIGTAELYRVVEATPGIVDSLVVDTGSLEREGELWLFVALAEGRELDAALAASVTARLRGDVSPRHVPDRVIAVAEIPRTLNGKKLEVPVKRLLAGEARERVLQPGTLANPGAVDALLVAAAREGAVVPRTPRG
ncbi:MAG: acetoacetate--CoA ligase, partial [Deltaproteobacteria bacterium]|nr:acetoacetate--CoA ligase [Deltaproteobacteria bacterium]